MLETIGYIFSIPFILGVTWLIGTIFRQNVLSHKVDKGNKYIQTVFSIAVGIVLVMILGAITNKMGCHSDDDSFFRE